MIEKREREKNSLWMRNDTVPEAESSVEDSSEPESFEQKKKRENIEEYHVIRRLSKSQRRKRIIEKTQHMIDNDPVEEIEAKKMHDFLNKINREELYPTSII